MAKAKKAPRKAKITKAAPKSLETSRLSDEDLEKGLSGWDAVIARFTIFKARPGELSGADSLEGLWRSRWGGSPSEIKRTPDNMRIEATGVTPLGKLRYFEDAVRSEIRLLAEEGAAPMGVHPTLGPASRVITTTLSQFGPLLEGAAESNRLAIGLSISRESATRENGIRLLAGLIPQVNFDDLRNGRDFRFEINMRNQSKNISNLLLNNYLKFGMSTVSGYMFNPSTGSVIHEPERHYIEYEMDINSAPDNPKVISKSKQNKVFNELLDLTIQHSCAGSRFDV